MTTTRPSNAGRPAAPRLNAGGFRTALSRYGLAALCALWVLAVSAAPARAGIAYGSLNNFDCVNDTGSEAHGFDIELTDVHSTEVTYTYDYNHYGVPKITEDNTDPLHPKVLVRYASAKNPDGTWAAYTAIPSGPIAPTDGHQFTDPTVNFGGEHFGVGYYGVPTAVRYTWLIDDGSGNLVQGPPVNVGTPTFTYIPPVGPAPPAVVAVIAPPPPPPAAPVTEFGDAMWVKSIKTTTHNPLKVHLNDLVADDPGNLQPWANGEQSEVETEWKLLQTKTGAAGGGKNGELQGAPEELPVGDEVITRRYEFYKYTGPFDADSGEAMADAVGPDGSHGTGSVTYIIGFDPDTGEPIETTTDLSTVAVVGDFFGAQMSGFDVAPILGLIDHVADGRAHEPCADRTVVVAGAAPFSASITAGELPDGMHFNGLTGVLSGTPDVAGNYSFTIEASDGTGPAISRAYTMAVVGKVAFSSYAVKGTPGSTVTLRCLVYNPTAPVSGLSIDFAVDGVFVGSGLSDGTGASCSYTIPADAALGTHTITVSYAGDAAFPAASRDTDCLTVYVRKAAVGFSMYATRGLRGQTVDLHTLMISGGAPVAGRSVDFSVDGTPVGSGVSDASGALCGFTIPGDMAAGAHDVTVAFAGDGYYYAASRTTAVLTVVVPKANVGLSPYTARGAPGETVALRSLVYSGGAPASGLTVSFAVDGTVVGSGLSDGTGASYLWTIPGGMAAGSHNLTVSFAGDATHNAAARTVACITVK